MFERKRVVCSSAFSCKLQRHSPIWFEYSFLCMRHFSTSQMNTRFLFNCDSKKCIIFIFGCLFIAFCIELLHQKQQENYHDIVINCTWYESLWIVIIFLGFTILNEEDERTSNMIAYLITNRSELIKLWLN